MWARRAAKAANELTNEEQGELWFLTLTLGRSVKSVQVGYSLLPGLWDTTRKNYQRKLGSFSYLAFVEGQPNRSYMPHFHILTVEAPPVRPGKHGNITQHSLHDWAHALGWGFEAKLLIVNGPEAMAYVAKYASKISPFTPKSFRRVRASRDWPKDDKPKGGAWITPAFKEDIPHFLQRAADFTGLAIEDCYTAYSTLMDEIKDSQVD
jgi:hypothetical protein